MKEIKIPTYASDMAIGGVERVVNVVFERINWGRIVCVYAFCAALAHRNKDRPNYLLKLEYDFGRALSINARAWFDSHNGWYGFQTFMANRKPNNGLGLLIIAILFYYVWKWLG